MVHDLMLPMTGTAGDAEAADSAIALASQLGARLAVLLPIRLPAPMPMPWGAMPDAGLGGVYAELRARGASEAAKMEARLCAEGIGFEVRTVEACLEEPSQLAALHARYADLALVAAPRADADDAAAAHAYFASLLFESGRPVMTLPPRQISAWPLRHVVVAWTPTRESTRALHDAMPLLGLATSIDIVVVDPMVAPSRHGEDPGVDVAAHLARHGYQVNVASLPSAGRSVAATLLRHAAESGAQLLVAGGYGHTRLREWILGGTTRELFEHAPLPVLFSR